MHPSIVLVLLAACATARPAPPRLAPPLDRLAFYVGTWHCKGTTHVPREDHWDATVVVRPELDGHWLSVEMIGPGDNHTAEHKGYDPTHQRWVHVAVVNDGEWDVRTSPGWDGDHMVFASVDPSDTSRTIFTKLGERSYSHAVTQGNAPQWEKVCSKS